MAILVCRCWPPVAKDDEKRLCQQVVPQTPPTRQPCLATNCRNGKLSIVIYEQNFFFFLLTGSGKGEDAADERGRQEGSGGCSVRQHTSHNKRNKIQTAVVRLRKADPKRPAGARPLRFLGRMISFPPGLVTMVKSLLLLRGE